MAKELEFKYELPNEEQLRAVLACGLVSDFLQGEWAEIPMETSYYDTISGDLANLRWTLRYRNEGGTGVVCLKTPTDDPNARNEYEVEADCLCIDAIDRLIELGAPAELRTMVDISTVKKLCGARFTRRVAEICLPGGTRANISGDWGMLYGGDDSQPLCEIEVELTAGSENTVKGFCALLAKDFGLELQPMSKFARARALAKK